MFILILREDTNWLQSLGTSVPLEQMIKEKERNKPFLYKAESLVADKLDAFMLESFSQSQKCSPKYTLSGKYSDILINLTFIFTSLFWQLTLCNLMVPKVISLGKLFPS